MRLLVRSCSCCRRCHYDQQEPKGKSWLHHIVVHRFAAPTCCLNADTLIFFVVSFWLSVTETVVSSRWHIQECSSKDNHASPMNYNTETEKRNKLCTAQNQYLFSPLKFLWAKSLLLAAHISQSFLETFSIHIDIRILFGIALYLSFWIRMVTTIDIACTP